MRKLKVVADDAIPFLKGVLEPFANVVYLPGSKICAADVADADALLVRTRTCCNKELLDCSNVQFVATATIGTDHFDREYLTSKGVDWTNAPACNADSVLQYITATLLEISVRTGRPLNSMTLGIVGIGNIGSRVKKRAELLGMKVLCSDAPKAGELKDHVPLPELYERSDIVTFHTPLTRSGEFATFHLLDSKTLECLKQNAWVINASRGEVVDNEALLFALRAKRIAGAVLDVWENEPAISKELLNNVLFGTPHIAGYSQDGKSNATTSIVRCLVQHFKGQFPELLALENFAAEPPSVPYFDVGCSQLSKNDAVALERELLQVFKVSYDIARDDMALRANPADFERLRKEYPLRREPRAHVGSVKDATSRTLGLLKAMEFCLK